MPVTACIIIQFAPTKDIGSIADKLPKLLAAGIGRRLLYFISCSIGCFLVKKLISAHSGHKKSPALCEAFYQYVENRFINFTTA
ncbi:hypothetical protein [Taibaiella soli]|uniref:Uncharacterized protein n=1 Tax=Taibaiella soli TaxID=1649169 RepID=A0A2W2B774_9BACT|nr:hypothetical protein [Taibaiella soli]PZF72099.1 hypothetical protein DN068_14275 [Taibaiella soli]